MVWDWSEGSFSVMGWNLSEKDLRVCDEISGDGAGRTRPHASAYSKISVPMAQQ
ncbi:MAG: hypothetical protein NVS2B15_15820 [Pseudarthrobacter sp.]